MEQRDDVLREAIIRNAEETERWEKYRKENETAIENMERFVKHLTVDVMVPVGKKAFMAGQLVHTNEILVGHYQGYFSKCSAHKAKEICEWRIKTAEEHLKKLLTEAELWQNKLDKPYVEGVVPCGEERDIIEPYDEAAEKQWRIEHKARVRQFKQEEKKERELALKQDEQESAKKTEDNDDKIFQMLEVSELLEELEGEFDNLELDEVNDETIRKLMSGELKLPQKERVAHAEAKQDKSHKKSKEQLKSVKQQPEEKHSTDFDQTNDKSHPNTEALPLNITSQDQDIDEKNKSDSDELPEVQLIKKQAASLPIEDQPGFYDQQIQISKQKLKDSPLQDENDLNEKIRLRQVLDELETLLETVEDEEQYKEEQMKKFQEQRNKNSKRYKRRISFANKNQTLEFNTHQTVKQMLRLKRDVVTLDEPIASKVASKTEKTKKKKTVVKEKQSVLDRVEQNRKHTEENQSERDYDMVNKILDNSLRSPTTLHIRFKHSQQSKNNCAPQPIDTADDENNKHCTPADIYEKYLKTNDELQGAENAETKTIFLNSYEGEEDVKAPILTEAKREHAYVDPRAEFSKQAKSKSILRNKDAVKNEKRSDMNQEQNVKNSSSSQKTKNNSKSKENTDEFLTVYDKVMGDVVEKPEVTKPDPLPNCNYIDAHMPKQRVSRFKQIRSRAQSN